jgi:hypothetical protein
MRRTLAFVVLLALTAISIGCASSSDQRGTTTTTNANATGTTTYGNSSVPAATPAQSDSGGAVPRAAPPRESPTQPKIKPPTEE